MKYLIALLLLIPNAQADSLELISGSITQHFVAPHGTYWFTKKLNDDGRLIYNSLYGIRYSSESDNHYWSVTAFAGDNSVGVSMTGAEYSYGYKALSWLYLGGVIGLYKQERTYGDNPTEFFDKVVNTGLVPIIGIEINGKLNLYKNSFIKLNNLITPILSNTSLSIGLNL